MLHQWKNKSMENSKSKSRMVLSFMPWNMQMRINYVPYISYIEHFRIQKLDQKNNTVHCFNEFTLSSEPTCSGGGRCLQRQKILATRYLFAEEWVGSRVKIFSQGEGRKQRHSFINRPPISPCSGAWGSALVWQASHPPENKNSVAGERCEHNEPRTMEKKKFHPTSLQMCLRPCRWVPC